MSENLEKKTPAPPKENLTWKINYLAAQVGETTHMKTAIIAASRAKYQKIHSEGQTQFDQENLRIELYNARKAKLETKLHQARRELRAALKKGKNNEIQRQCKKITSARKLLEAKKKEETEEETKEKIKEDTMDEIEEENKEKPVEKKAPKVVTAEEIEAYEKELSTLKSLNLNDLAEKTIKNKLLKEKTLKNEELIKDLIETSIQPFNLSDPFTQKLESRVLSQKEVLKEVSDIMSSFQNIIKGDHEKIEKRKADELKKKKLEESRKRKAEEAEKDKLNNKKPKTIKPKVKAGTSEFVDTLGDNDDENEDENFQKIYEGEKKPNRVGQKQRRKQWEEKYGREANHIAAEFQKREEKRLANPDYKPKKKPAPKQAHISAAPAEPVHPSWEAKRLQEEIMSKALSGKGGPSNNKIVFEDSD